MPPFCQAGPHAGNYQGLFRPKIDAAVFALYYIRHHLCSEKKSGEEKRQSVVWVHNGGYVLCPDRFNYFVSPGDLTFITLSNHQDRLWCAEEVLRSGAFSVLVLDLDRAPDLTAGRRLQLAAGHGQTTGLCLTPYGQACHAAETRWSCRTHPFSPLACIRHPDRDFALYSWERIKNKSGPNGRWTVGYNHELLEDKPHQYRTLYETLSAGR